MRAFYLISSLSITLSLSLTLRSNISLIVRQLAHGILNVGYLNITLSCQLAQLSILLCYSLFMSGNPCLQLCCLCLKRSYTSVITCPA